jgi:hypothetical protein
MPIALIQMFPNQKLASEIAAMVMPIFGFCLRALIGMLRFKRGGHYRWQVPIFCVAIMLLALIDCVFILFHTFPMGHIRLDDWLILFGLYGVYVVIMLMALFPAKSSAVVSN